MYKLLIGCCIVIYTLCLSEIVFSQPFSFQAPQNQKNTASSSPSRSALSPDQFRKNVRAMGDANRKTLADIAKKNQKPLPANLTLNTTMGTASKNPIPKKTGYTAQQGTYPPSQQPTGTPSTTPKPGTSPGKPESPQNSYYTGTQFQGGSGTGSSGKQWNINY